MAEPEGAQVVEEAIVLEDERAQRRGLVDHGAQQAEAGRQARQVLHLSHRQSRALTNRGLRHLGRVRAARNVDQHPADLVEARRVAVGELELGAVRDRLCGHAMSHLFDCLGLYDVTPAFRFGPGTRASNTTSGSRGGKVPSMMATSSFVSS